MKSSFTAADGCRLHYETYGLQGMRRSEASRSAVIFLSGTTQTALQWRPQALFFRDQFPVVCYDGRAQGKSDPGSRKLSLDLHVEDLYCLLAFLRVGRAHLVGLSHGAQVALAFAASHPEKTARLVLCGVGAEPGPRTRAVVRSWMEILDINGLSAMAWAALPVILGETYLRANERLLPKMVSALVARNRKDSLLAHFAALLTYPPPSDNAKRISRPCLVISGSDDLLNPPASARRLARMIAADYEQFEQVGHSVPVEAAGRFNRTCHRFLSADVAPYARRF